jgi:hypothetical protein
MLASGIPASLVAEPRRTAGSGASWGPRGCVVGAQLPNLIPHHLQDVRLRGELRDVQRAGQRPLSAPRVEAAHPRPVPRGVREGEREGGPDPLVVDALDARPETGERPKVSWHVEVRDSLDALKVESRADVHLACRVDLDVRIPSGRRDVGLALDQRDVCRGRRPLATLSVGPFVAKQDGTVARVLQPVLRGLPFAPGAGERGWHATRFAVDGVPDGEVGLAMGANSITAPQRVEEISSFLAIRARVEFAKLVMQVASDLVERLLQLCRVAGDECGCTRGELRPRTGRSAPRVARQAERRRQSFRFRRRDPGTTSPGRLKCLMNGAIASGGTFV